MNPPYVMRRNGMGYASMATHVGPWPRGFRYRVGAAVPYAPAGRIVPPCPAGGGLEPPGARPSPGTVDFSQVLDGVVFDKGASEFATRETLAVLFRRLGGTVTDSGETP